MPPPDAPLVGAATPDPTQPQQGILPARPALEVDLSVKLSPERRAQLGRQIVREIDRYRAVNERRRDNLQEWRRNAQMDVSDDEGPWENASAVRTPGTANACAGHTQRLNAQIVGPAEPFRAVARKAAVVPLCDAITEALTAKLDEADWKTVARDLHTDLPVSGNDLIRVEWCHETEKRPRLQVDWDPDAALEGLQDGAHPVDAFVGAAKTDRSGQAKVMLGYEEVTVYDGIRLKLVRWEDSVILPATCRDPAQAYGIGERTMEFGADLRKGVKNGQYYEDAVEELLLRRGDPRPQDWQEGDDLTGTESGAGDDNDDPLKRQFECYELAYKADLDDDGEEERYIVTVHYGTAKVLRCQYSPYEHGQAHYVPFGYLKRPGELLAMSIAERLAVPQDAANALANQFFDIVDLLSGQAGNFFYDEESGLDITRFQFQPGTPVKVDSVKGILPMAFAQGLASALTECREGLQMLKDWTDTLSATSNPALGRETEGQKTLGEVQLVLSQGMQIFEDYAAGVALCWAKVWDQVRWNCAQFAEKGVVEYRKAARPDDALTDDTGSQTKYTFESISADVLRADVDLVPAGLNQFADAQTRLQRSVMLYNLAVQNPLVAQDPSLLVLFFGMVLHDARCPEEEQVVAKLQQAVIAQQQAQQMQQQMQILAMMNQTADQKRQQDQAAALEQAPQTIASEAYQKYQEGADTHQGQLALSALTTARKMQAAGQPSVLPSGRPPNGTGPG
jgi:hypothetical protein